MTVTAATSTWPAPPGRGWWKGCSLVWYDRQDLPFETTPSDGRSDYDAFTTAGIPAGGIFAGAEVVKTRKQVKLYGGTAGEPFDPCYHLRCDVLAKIDRDGLREHKNAAVHAI